MDSTEEQLLRQLNDAKIREYAPAIAFSAVVVVCGILGNALSVAFYGFKVPRTSTNIIITVLAIVDIITCIVISDEIVELCFTVTFKNIWGCKAMYFFNHSLVFISIFTLFLVAIDRFRKICRPFAWQYSSFGLKLSFIAIIIFAVLLSVRDLFILDVVHVNVTHAGRNIRAYYCTHSKAQSMATTVTTFHSIDLLTIIIICVFTVVIYSCIAKQLLKSRIKRRQSVNINEVNDSSDSKPTSSPDTDIIAEESFAPTDEQIQDCDKEEESYGINIPQENNDESQLKKIVYAKKIGVGDPERYAPDTNEENVYSHKPRKDMKDVDRRSSVNVMCKRPLEAKNVERKVTLMIFTLNVAFFVSFIPYFIVNVWVKQQSNSSAQEFNAGIQIALRSYMLNNAINPYIIGFFNSNFRTFVKSLFCNV